MSKQITIAVCVLSFCILKTEGVLGREFGLPRLTFPSIVISIEGDPGPFFTAAPQTLPKKAVYLGGRYIYSDFQTFWGLEIEEFEERNDPLSGDNHVDFTYQIVQLTMAYGITDDWLIGTMIPWKRIFFERTWEGSIYAYPGGFQDGDEGIGDVVLSTRYKLFDQLEEKPFSWGVGLDVKLPTGDDRAIRAVGRGVGTGKTDYKTSTMLAKSFAVTSVYWSLAYNREGRDTIFDTLEYDLAFVFPITPKVSITGEFLGVSFVNWSVDLDFGGVVDTEVLNTYDIGVAMKYQAKGTTVEVGVTYPLNDDFTRTKLQPTIGIHYVF